jgi:3-vinyl bacteriochlorophyllide hydratase
MFTLKLVDRVVAAVDCCPWDAAAGRREKRLLQPRRQPNSPLYTPDQRRRRDQSRWTIVQGVLAPVQFAVFLVSLSLVLHYLATGHGLAIATASIVLKTLLLYAIMVTGSIWERAVFGRYLFAAAFFWEDVVSILVLALHTTYLVALFSGAVDAERQMWLALAAYASYVVNATQFVLKLRAARRDEHKWMANGALGQAS